MPGGLAVIGSESSVLEYQDSGGKWRFVPGISSWTESGGDAPTRDVVAFEGVGSKTGRQRPQTIECEVAAYAPQHPGWKYMRAAAVAKTVIRVRLTSLKEVIYKGTAEAKNRTIAIAETTGLVTTKAVAQGPAEPDFTESTFAPGMVIEIGNDRYTIAYIKGINTNAADEEQGLTNPANDGIGVIMRVTAAGAIAAVAATGVYNVVIPALRRGPFAAEIVTTDNSTLAAEGDLSSGLTLRPKSLLPEWTVVG